MADKLRSSGVPDVTALAQHAKNLADDGKVDRLDGLNKHRVYLFSGDEDRIVVRSVVEAAQTFYTKVGVPDKNIAFVTRPDAGHTFLTVDAGNTCESSASPFVSDCDYDQSGAILKWIYGDLQTPARHETGKYVVFDQSPFDRHW